MVVPWWCYGGPIVVLWWSHGGPMVVLWWSHGGPMVVPWWSYGGSILFMIVATFAVHHPGGGDTRSAHSSH